MKEISELIAEARPILNSARLEMKKPIRWLTPRDIGLYELMGIPVKTDFKVKTLTLETEF